MTRRAYRLSLFAAGRSRIAVIWGVDAVLVVVTVVLWLVSARHLSAVPAPVHLAWPVLALCFAAGHVALVRVEFHGTSHVLDFTDVVLLPAIVFGDPEWVVLAAMLGTAVNAVWNHQSRVKFVFNVALHGLVSVVALLIFHDLVGTATVLSVRGSVSALVAMLAAAAVTVGGIQGVISIWSGSFGAFAADQLASTLLSILAIDVTLGLAAVRLLWTGLGGGVLFLAVAAAVAFEYANHGRLRIRHTTLSQLYRFEKALAGIVESEMVVAAVLTEALELFNVEVAQLVLDVAGGRSCHTLRAGDERPVASSDVSHPLADLLEASSRVLLAPRGARDPQLAAALAACGLRDALALRLPDDVATGIEVLVVGNRLGGEHVTFDASDVGLAETLATPTAVALRSSDLLNQLRDQVAIKEHQASHDALTGLANRTLFSARLDDAMAGRHDGELVGVMLIDLDGFKGLNDTLGHEAGDAFLQSVARALEAAVGERGFAGRLGGDEFAVVVPAARQVAEVVAIAHEVDSAVRAPASVADTAVELRASIGVSIGPVHGDDRFTLLRHADLAMYRAKQHGGGVALHDDDHDPNIDRPSLIAALREAIHSSTLRLRYQPKISCATGELVGVEALLRWTHPRYGAIAPDQFVPVAERSGLIRPLTRWVLATALGQCGEWHRAGLAVNLAVNLSATQIDDREVLEQIRALLELHGLPPTALTLEITESAALAGDPGAELVVLDALASLGVRLSIDDFGVGTSSLARLKHLPVSEVKIDKSFITHLTSEAVDDMIVASTIGLAHQLGVEVVAEGVEDEATLAKLGLLGCDIAQGYLIGAPLRADELAGWVRRRKALVLDPPAYDQLTRTAI